MSETTSPAPGTTPDMTADRAAAARVAAEHGRQAAPGSARGVDGLFFWAESGAAGGRLVVATLANHALGANAAVIEALGPEIHASGGWTVFRANRAPATDAALRALLPNLAPRPLGLATSAGFGDRLGLATPGHVDALNACGAAGKVAAIFGQQSMRENARTGRTPREVVDDATWGAFTAGWQHAVGADADHLKTEADIDLCLAAGYSFFTIDPGEHVNPAADTLEGAKLQEAFDALPWQALETTPGDLRARLGGARVDLGAAPAGASAAAGSGAASGMAGAHTPADVVTFAPGALERAAVKYGRAVAHVARLARHLVARAGYPTELEVSVDETPTPTSFAEHVYFATELRRLGVRWVSLAPRFVGEFEKGVEYIGDLGELARCLRGHAAIATQLGPYKLSLHSGSDKFAVYPIAAAATGGLVHLKTAGTSYLEALRVVGAHEPELLRRVAELAVERFAEDVHSYHISGSPARMPDLSALDGTAICALLEQLDARQVLHVTFGSALKAHGAEIRALLRREPAAYRAALRRHFERHIAPLVTLPATGARGAG